MTEPKPAPASAVVLSSELEDHILIHSACADLDWNLYSVESLSQALGLFREHSFSLALAAEEFAGGAWRNLLDAFEVMPAAPRLIVMSNTADSRLWAEVLNLGGYDVLPKPLWEPELRRVIEHALAGSRAKSSPAAKSVSAAAT